MHFIATSFATCPDPSKIQSPRPSFLCVLSSL